MNVTADDARLLFGRWRDASTAVRVKLSNKSVTFDGVGTTEMTADALQFSGLAWQFTAPLAGAEFSFSDPREIPIASVREAETSKYEFAVAVTLANGDRLTLLEMKSESEPDS
jgi:hypothetical protein